MSMVDWTVIIVGLTAIAWVNWYFFLAQAVSEQSEKKNVGQHSSIPR